MVIRERKWQIKKRLKNGELHNLYFTRYYYNDQLREDKMDRTWEIRYANMALIRELERHRAFRRLSHRLEDIIKIGVKEIWWERVDCIQVAG
jgi:hypothetical protein